MYTNLTTPFAAGISFGSDLIAATNYQRIKISFGAEGTATDVSAAAPMPVAIISGGGTGGLTNTELRAAALAVTVGNFPATQPVSGPLTDAQLRAAGVTVTGPLTDTQLRAAALPISAAALPLPAGAATEATQALVLTTAAFQARIPTLGQKVGSGSVSVVLASDQIVVATDGVVRGNATDRGGTIAAANTAQVLMPLNAARRGFTIQNQSAADLYVNTIGAATPNNGSLRIAAGAYYESPAHFIGTGAISIIGGTAGQAFYAREF